MRLVNFLLILLALFIATCFAFRNNPTYPLPEPIPIPTKETSVPHIDAPLVPLKNQAGKQLFKANCASCHNRNMKDKMIGPALGAVQERWAGREDLLYAWIRNSAAVVASGDAYAVQLFKDWKSSTMPAFPRLTDAEIDHILKYIEEVYLQ